MLKVLIIGEHDGKTLNPATLKCVTGAKGLQDPEITIALLGADTAAVAAQAAAVPGVHKVLRVDRPENAHALAALYAPQIVALAADYTHIFGPSTSFGKDLTPRIAALLGVLSLMLLVATLVIASVSGSLSSSGDIANNVSWTVFVLAFTVVGVVVARRQQESWG